MTTSSSFDIDGNDDEEEPEPEADTPDTVGSFEECDDGVVRLTIAEAGEDAEDGSYIKSDIAVPLNRAQ